MLFNKKMIIQTGMFDKNFFLYLEEIDLCKRIKLANHKIYVSKNSKVSHLAAKSSNIGDEYEKCRNWHWMWSKFYYEKKYNNIFFVYIKFLFLLSFQLIKIIFYFLSFQKKKKSCNKNKIFRNLKFVNWEKFMVQARNII